MKPKPLNYKENYAIMHSYRSPPQVGFEGIIKKDLMQAATITFEQPLNECIRICLRLEYLFRQFHNNIHVSQFSTQNAQLALIKLIEMMNVIDRPDLKSRLTQTLTQNAATLSQLQQLPQINQKHLREILTKLDPLINELHSTHTKIAESLRNNDFLNAVRTQVHNPGGVCDFALPMLAVWLTHHNEEQKKELLSWFQEFNLLESITEIILDLTRESTVPEKLVAADGFYQRTLNPATPCQLVRVTIAKDLNVYPELSVGKHRLSVHFLETSYLDGKRLGLRHQDIEFELSCCRI